MANFGDNTFASGRPSTQGTKVKLSVLFTLSLFSISDARGLLARGELDQPPRDEDRHAERGRGRGQLRSGAGDGPTGE